MSQEYNPQAAHTQAFTREVGADGSDSIGSQSDAAVSDPTASGSLIAFTKGLKKGQGQVSDAAATDSTSSWSIIALLKGILAQALNTAAVAVYSGWSYANITTKTTTLVKSGAGTSRGIAINKVGTADTLTVYDSLTASGTVIATITVIATDVWRELPANFAIGMTVVSGGTTAGDYTVYYR